MSPPDVPLSQIPHSYRSSDGCWTCRLRRKKCDERRPKCRTCDTLSIPCYFNQERPDWMDGGLRQEEMAEDLKRQVKAQAPFRRWNRHRENYSPGTQPSERNEAQARSQHASRSVDCTLVNLTGLSGVAGHVPGFGRHDTVLLSLYMDHVLPLLYPAYNPSPLQGGKSWILELFLSSPVFRQAVSRHATQWMHQFSEATVADTGPCSLGNVLEQTQRSFQSLRGALQVINGAYISEHLHGSVRILASIVVMQRFEVEMLRFETCRIHLSAALTLYQEIMASQDETGFPASDLPSTWNRVYGRLEAPAESNLRIPSAEQTAFKLSVASLLTNDIIASLASQQRPVLYTHHTHLLGDSEGAGRVTVNLSDIIGCQNWALLSVGQIATLDAWKLEHQRTNTLDMMELAGHATPIKDGVGANMRRLLEQEASAQMTRGSNLHDPYSAAGQIHIITRIWANAALLYLSVVVLGEHPGRDEVRDTVQRVVDLITVKLYPKTLLRMVLWPLFVTGYLAGLEEECQMRTMIKNCSRSRLLEETLQRLERAWAGRGGDAYTPVGLGPSLRSLGGEMSFI